MSRDLPQDSEGSPAPALLRRPPRLGEEVYNALYAQLMTQAIPPGGRISVDSLVRQLGVSQTPIREALSRLEAKGLVVKTHLLGYRAAGQLDRPRLEKLFELRLLLEPHAAGRAAARLEDDAEALPALRRLAETMRAGEGDDDPARAYGRFAGLDSEFHDRIALAAGNELVQETLANLHAHVHLFRMFYHARATSEAIAEHDTIIAAIAARDSPAAEAAMRQHVERARLRFLSCFDR